MAKKSLRQKAVDRADTAFSLYIRLRDNYVCFTCGATKAQGAVIQCGHLISRRHYATRWQEGNAHVQCSGCNRLHSKDPSRYYYKFLQKYGKEIYDELYILSTAVAKFTTPEILDIAVKYENRIKALEAERKNLYL